MGAIRRRIFLAAPAALALGLLLQPIGPATAAGALEPLRVRFTWKLKGEDAPLFVALDKGYYAAAGLDLDLAEGSGAETVVKVIGAGGDSIGYGPATVVAEAVGEGLPIKVVAIYQPSAPLGLISFPDVPLRTPKDLEGRVLGLATGETFSNMLQPFAKLNGVDLSKVKRLEMDTGTRNPQYMMRKIDVISVYLNNELPMLQAKAGVKFNALRASDFGLKLLGASFFVNDAFAASHPEAIRKLLGATAKGYRDAIADPEGATTIMDKYMKLKLDRKVLAEQVAETLAATRVPEDEPLGWQRAEEWQNNLELLKSTGSIRLVRPLDAYYTNAFLQ